MRRVVEAQDQAHERGFADPRGSDQRDVLTRVHLEGDVLQHGPSSVIGEGDVFEPHLAPEVRRSDGIRSVTNLGHPFEQIEHALTRCRGLCQPANVLGEVLHWLERALEVRQENQESSRSQPLLDDQAAAAPQHQGRSNRNQDVNRAFEMGGQALALHVLAEARSIVSRKDLGERSFERECLHGLDRPHRFRRGGGHRTFSLTLLSGDFTDTPPEGGRRQPEQRGHGQGDEPELPAEGAHQDHHAEKEEKLAEKR